MNEPITVRLLEERDLETATRIMRNAFGTFLNVPDLDSFWLDQDFLKPRWTAQPSGVFVAERDGEILGSNIATRWGSVGFFGPLSVRPELWDQGIGKLLMEPVLARFDEWGLTHTGLYTFADSPKHAALYQKFSFWSRFLTAIMTQFPDSKQLEVSEWTRFSSLSDDGKTDAKRAVNALTDAIYPGLSLEIEIDAVDGQGLGDTVLLQDGGRITGFAVCHCGFGTEAGTDRCYLKFGAVAPGDGAGEQFRRLLGACQAFAAERKLKRLVVGINLGRHQAYKALLESGYRISLQGVAMHRNHDPGYSRPNDFVLDDWR